MSNPNYFGTGGNNANNGSTQALRNLTWAGSVADTTTDDTIILTTNGVVVTTSSGISIANNRVLKGENPVTSKITTTAAGGGGQLLTFSDLDVSGTVVVKDVYLDGATPDTLNLSYGASFGTASPSNIEGIIFDGCTLANVNQGMLSVTSGGTLVNRPMSLLNTKLEGAYNSVPNLPTTLAPAPNSVTPQTTVFQVSGTYGTTNIYSGASFVPLIFANASDGGDPWGTYQGVGVFNLVDNNFTIATVSDAGADGEILVLAGSNGGIFNVLNNHIVFDDSSGTPFTSPVISNIPSAFIDCQGSRSGIGNEQRVISNTFHFPFAKSFCNGRGGSGSYSSVCMMNGNDVKSIYHATYKPYGIGLPDDGVASTSFENRYFPKAKAYGNKIDTFYNGIIFEGSVAPSYATAKYNSILDSYGPALEFDGCKGAAATYNLIYQSGDVVQRDHGLFHAKRAVADNNPTSINTTFSNNTIVVQDLSKIVALGSVNDGCALTVDNNDYYLPVGTDLVNGLLFRVGGTSGAANTTLPAWRALGYDVNSTFTLGTYSELEEARVGATGLYDSLYNNYLTTSGSGSSGNILGKIIG